MVGKHNPNNNDNANDRDRISFSLSGDLNSRRLDKVLESNPVTQTKNESTNQPLRLLAKSRIYLVWAL